MFFILEGPQDFIPLGHISHPITTAQTSLTLGPFSQSNIGKGGLCDNNGFSLELSQSKTSDQHYVSISAAA